jgi:hypothetical protein
MAGFASTIGWPLSAWLDHAIGWRGACLVWAAIHVAITLPCYLAALPPRISREPGAKATDALAKATLPRGAAALRDAVDGVRVRRHRVRRDGDGVAPAAPAPGHRR